MPINPIYTGLTIQPSLASLDAEGSETPLLEEGRGTGEKYYNLTVYDLFGFNLPSKIKITEEIGLEIECEGEKLFGAPLRWWYTHQDGSLRVHNGYAPVEYVLRKPVSRQDVSVALDYLIDRLNASGSKVVYSPRSSVHVHLNCQNLLMKQVINLICLYLIVEELLVEFSGEDRIGNMFCLRAKDSGYFCILLEESIASDRFNSRELCSENFRYTSCNVASLAKFGSLEFRSMRGTIDKTLIEQWIDILMGIKKQALALDNPQEIISLFEREKVLGILKFILPDHWELFSTHPNLSTIIWDGVRRVRDIAFATYRWEKPVEKKLKAPRKKKSVLEVEVTPVDFAPDPVDFLIDGALNGDLNGDF